VKSLIGNFSAGEKGKIAFLRCFWGEFVNDVLSESLMKCRCKSLWFMIASEVVS
jgi:hypothetical protein